MDISIDLDKNVLHCRTAGVVINDGKILLNRAKIDDYWTPLGGKIKITESSEKAVIREFKEELGIDVKIVRLLWMVENFFEMEAKSFHQYLFIYLLEDICGDLDCSDEEIEVLDNKDIVYKWFDLKEISKIKVKPNFLKNKLTDLPLYTEHIINEDN